MLCCAAQNTDYLPYGHFEDLRFDESNTVERVGNVDVVRDTDSVGDLAAVCHVAAFMGFSRVNGGCSQNQATKIYKELAATLLAMHHFNNGNGIVVKEVEGIQERCPIRFTAEFHDSQYTPNIVVQSITTILASRDPTNPQEILPCAVVGARTSSSTGPAAIISGVYDLPQMSYTATSPELNDQFKYPLFQRIVPADDAAAKAAVRFLTDISQSTHVAVLYINDPFGIGYNKAFQKETSEAKVTTQSFPLAFPPDPADIKIQLQKVKETGIRHVFLVIFSSYIEMVMSEAFRIGITGNGYFWLLGISTSFFENANLVEGSDLAKAIQGMGVLPEFGAKPNSAGYDRFVDVWNQLGDGDIEYFNSKVPTIGGVDDCFAAGTGFFSEKFKDSPGSTAHFAYDTIMALGLGACNATEDSFYFDGTKHSQSIVQTIFQGASGVVSIDPGTTSRDPLLFSYAVLNIKPQKATGGNVTFSTPESIILQPNTQLSDWKIIQETPFIFPDGTSNPPSTLPEITVDMNYIGELRILGYTMCAIIMGSAAGFAVWTYRNRHERVIRASQPPFLIMICLGTFVLGSVIIPLSVDDEHYSQRGTDIACMSQPWLASMGFVVAFSGEYISFVMSLFRVVAVAF
jgi:hypothetical protein